MGSFIWFILILKQTNKKQGDADNAHVILTFVKEMKEMYDYLWSYFLGKDINKISYLSSGLREGSVENEDFHFKHLCTISFFNQVNALHIF